MKYGEFLETWYSLYVLAGDLAYHTKQQYKRSIAAVPDWLREIDLDKLTVFDLRRWLVSVAGEHQRAAQLDRVMLSRSLGVAHDAGLISWEPTARSLPAIRHEARRAEVLTADQCRRYLAATPEYVSGLLLDLCLCGLRRGEALGVKRSDFDGQNLSITRQRYRVAGKGLEAAELKSEASRRILQLPPWLLDRIDRQPRTLAGWLVDTTPEQMRADHQAILAALGLPAGVTLHGLRHSFATAAAETVPIKVLQQALGHSEYKLTADLYAGHRLPSAVSVPVMVWR